MRSCTERLACWSLSIGLLVSFPSTASEPNDAADRHRVVRGMTVSCPRAGQAWGTDAMVETLERLERLGVNWVAIHPYASISADGTVRVRDSLYENPSWLQRPIREAHRIGLKIMIKPHLAYWGSPFSWRGEIRFDDRASWDRFFVSYGAWVARVAELSREADAFVVGTELDRTTVHETRWREIIATVRQRFDGPLTYAAGWDTYETVPFWDALDVIGIQAYFPLVDHDATPSRAEIDHGWQRWVARIEAYARARSRRVLFAELGYNRSALAASRPWDYRQGGDQAEAIQQRCLDAALSAIAGSETIVGAFLWKWFPGESARGNFIQSTPAMRRVISDHWSAGSAAEDSP